MVKVYLSSTYEDLKEYRQAVIQALRGVPGVRVVAMEDYGAFDERPLEKCVADVAACDAYIGIIAHRYGFRPIMGNPLDRSITELEYLTATEGKKPRLIYVVDPDMKWPPKFVDRDEKNARDLARFLEGIRHDHGTGSFADDADLAAKVRRDVVAKLTPSATPMHDTIGELAPKMCDRTLQEAAFKQFISATLSKGEQKPVLCFLPGREDACHDSFVERMRYFYATALSDSAADEPLTVKARPCNWIDDGSPDSCFNAIVTELFKDLRHGARVSDYSPRSFAASNIDSGREHVIVHHNIHYGRWKLATPILERYIRFWSETAIAPNRPQFMIVFKIKLPAPSMLARLLPTARQSPFSDLRKQVDRLVGGADCSALVFDELGPVDRRHLDDWFSVFQIPPSEHERQSELAKLFPRHDATLSMAMIQDQLQRICERHEYALMEMNIV